MQEIMLKKRVIEVVLVLIFLLLVTAILWITDADRFITSLVPRDLTIAAVLPECNRAWPIGNLFPWNVLYNVAPYPAISMGVLALIFLPLSFFVKKYTVWRRKAVFILFFLALGPGLVVNTLLKDQLGRARPRQVTEFGGVHEFTQCWQPGTSGENSSFPSGHASIAFFTMAPWFLLRERKQKIAASFLGLGLIFGSLVGVARILQGGHFVSDVIWAGGLLYLIGSILSIVMQLFWQEEQAVCQSV